MRPIALITGAAEGLGEALAAAFARDGSDIVGVSRSDRAVARLEAAARSGGGAYRHVRCDIGEPGAAARALAPFAADAAVFVHNAHRLHHGPFDATSEADFEALWRVTCFGAMASAHVVLPAMAAHGRGTALFTGATASVRGGATFAAFASAKFALRGLTQSLAREFGPKGVHVAHVILDGLLDEPQTQARFGEAANVRMAPGAVAEAYVALAKQSPSAWSYEFDLRPFDERF